MTRRPDDLDLKASPHGTRVRVRVTPRARKHEIAGVRHGAMLIRLAAPPVEGAANEALVEFLSERFNLPKRNVRLISGERAREKVVEIAGLGPEIVRRGLGV